MYLAARAHTTKGACISACRGHWASRFMPGSGEKLTSMLGAKPPSSEVLQLSPFQVVVRLRGLPRSRGHPLIKCAPNTPATIGIDRLGSEVIQSIPCWHFMWPPLRKPHPLLECRCTGSLYIIVSARARGNYKEDTRPEACISGNHLDHRQVPSILCAMPIRDTSFVIMLLLIIQISPIQLEKVLRLASMVVVGTSC